MVLIEHHIKYKEIHGYDETVWMERGEHTKLHNRLRREGKCNIPVNELNKISTPAFQRTRKSKEYHQTRKVKEYQHGHHQDKRIEKQSEVYDWRD